MISTDDNDDITSDYLTKELSLAEKDLEAVEEKQDEQVLLAFSSPNDDGNNDRQQQQQKQKNLPKSLQLLQLKTTADSLVLAQKVTEWLKTNRLSSEGGSGDNNNNNNILLLEESKICLNLNKILLEHNENLLEICPSLLEQTYLPLYEYVYNSMKASLKQILQQVQYPSSKGCLKLQQKQNPNNFKEICTNLRQLEICHDQLIQSIEGEGGITTKSNVVLLELFSPLVKRIRFHFVERSEDRVTSCRLDRLPEWIFNYIKEHVLLQDDDDDSTSSSSPVDVIKSLGDDGLLLEFFNHLTRLFHWVLMERNFFRDLSIAGPRSNPLLLCNAMEQLLLYDRCIQEQLSPSMMLMISGSSFSTPYSSSDNDEQHHQRQQNHHLVTMLDLLISYDEELIQWWMERERESVFATLFDDDSAVNVPKPLANHVSPRAELFCALIRSVQWKAAVLRNPGPYMRNVAIPLCNQFVDALQETCNDLRELLCQRHHYRGQLPPEDQLLANINEWIEIINGTHLAAQLLLREGAWQTDGMPATSQSDHDLARFGRSLRNLHTVMVEEFAKSFVETILMERAKLASYLMLASHILSSEEWEGSDDTTDLSPELRETKSILYQFHQLCNSILLMDNDTNDYNDVATTPLATIGNSNDQRNIADFAPLEMRSHVMNRIATKFLDVALDVDNLSPEIWQSSAKVFCRDVDVILGGPSAVENMPLARRLMEVTKLLSLDTVYIRSLFDALAGLVGSDGDYLDINDFTTDGTIYEEATSMIKAKGFMSLELEDALSVLNRRRD